MLATIAALLLIGWTVGLLLSMPFEGALHLLPAIAAVLLVAETIRLWRARTRKTGTSRDADA